MASSQCPDYHASAFFFQRLGIVVPFPKLKKNEKKKNEKKKEKEIKNEREGGNVRKGTALGFCFLTNKKGFLSVQKFLFQTTFLVFLFVLQIIWVCEKGTTASLSKESSERFLKGHTVVRVAG